MGDKDQLRFAGRIIIGACLLHRLDRHVVLTEGRCDSAKNAWLVVDMKRKAVCREKIGDGRNLCGWQRTESRMGASSKIGCRVDEIAEHCASGGFASGASSIEHEFANGSTFDEHGIEAVAHGGEWVRARNHRWVHSNRHLGLALRHNLFGDSDEFDDVIVA